MQTVLSRSSWASSPSSYEPHFKQQTTPDRLTQPDKFTIGNRWTVRGFDGESSLYADKGWYLRNDINLNLPVWGMQPYIGADLWRSQRLRK
ncbi:Hemolysin activator protein precursor [Enterobacter asburiae]|uniref:Hemolysin activator protein n=1 Tax=Enterobacter asburiae TaxID=61645 RepID=A0A376F2T2_ENTAS|nr:Hemolysin activator protein precursor [Enterobacter asburiae]